MSITNELQSKVLTSSINGSNINIENKNIENTNKDFDSVMSNALEKSNDTKENIGCLGNPKVSNALLSSEKLTDISQSEIKNINETNATNEEEKLTAGSCFTMFIRISTRITTEVNEVMSGKFKDTTLAFADALKADKIYNENLLQSYLQKTEEMISNQTEVLKSYIDNMFSLAKSSLSGFNSTLLGSSNLLGNAFSNYSNLLNNSALLGASANSNLSLSSTLLSGLSSCVKDYSKSSSLAGYAAADVATTQLNALLSGTSNYAYGIGTSLNTNRYYGRSLSIIKETELKAVGNNNAETADNREGSTTSVSSIDVENKNNSTENLLNASDLSSDKKDVTEDSVNSSDIDVSTENNEKEANIEIKLADNTEGKNPYIEAFRRKNRIVSMFKEMVLNNKSLDSLKDNMETNIDISFA